MKKTIADKWVKALRSGDYKQGRGLLCENDKFCCLGVLCDIAVKNDVAVKVTIKGGEFFKRRVYDTFHNQLPRSVTEWAGMKKNNFGGKFKPLDLPDDVMYESLWELNDLAKKNFNEIATVIERHYKYL